MRTLVSVLYCSSPSLSAIPVYLTDMVPLPFIWYAWHHSHWSGLHGFTPIYPFIWPAWCHSHLSDRHGTIPIDLIYMASLPPCHELSLRISPTLPWTFTVRIHRIPPTLTWTFSQNLSHPAMNYRLESLPPCHELSESESFPPCHELSLSESLPPCHELSVRIPSRRSIFLPFVMSEWCWRELLSESFVWSDRPMSKCWVLASLWQLH